MVPIAMVVSVGQAEPRPVVWGWVDVRYVLFLCTYVPTPHDKRQHK